MNKNTTALLTIAKVPSSLKDRTELIEWLRRIASEIKKEDPKIYATPCRFRLMK